MVKYSDDDDRDQAKELIMERGDKFHVYRGLRHQMYALEDSDLFEFSTEHFDSDSNRIIKAIEMKVIISMSGMSSRFTNAGYNVPKFMIEVDGKTVIEHIVDLYPIDSDFIFIINDEHAKDMGP